MSRSRLEAGVSCLRMHLRLLVLLVAGVLIGAVTLSFGARPASADPSAPGIAPNFDYEPWLSDLMPGETAALDFEVVAEPEPTVGCQWQSAGTGAVPGAWTDIGGATSCSGFASVEADAGRWLRVRVTASNGEGASQVESVPTRVGGELVAWKSTSPDSGIVAYNANGTQYRPLVAAGSPGGGLAGLAQSNWALDPSGTRLAYESTSDPLNPIATKADTSIWVMNTDGTNRVPVGDTAFNDKNPRWSPDGRQLVFESVPGNCSGTSCVSANKLFVAQADGTGQVSIYTLPYPNEAVNWNTYSLQAEWNWANDRIYFVQPDNKWHRKAVPYGGTPVHYSEWEAPYTSNYLCPAPGPGGWSPVLCYRGQDVWSISPAGGSPRLELPNKTTNPANPNDPTWWNRTCAYPSANERRCRILTNTRVRSTAFLYVRDSASGWRLSGGDLSGSDPTERIFYPTLFGADWGPFSPSFSQLVYSANGYIWRIRTSDGTKLKQLTLAPREWGLPPLAKNPVLPLAQACGLGYGEFALDGGEATDDVHAGFGFFERHETDLQMAGGIDVPFVFERSYSSGSGCAGGGDLGAGGWRHSFESSLTIGGNGDVTAISPSGQRLVFTKNADGTYTPAPGGEASKLVKLTSTYELSFGDRTVSVYSLAGKFQQIRTRNGKTITLAYDGSGRLVSVTDTVGRTVTLVRDAANPARLASVALPDGRQVAYSYDASGRLASVTDPRGKVWQYEYDANGRLSRVVDPRGNDDVRVTYDTAGRVTTRTNALGKTISFAWDSARKIATITDAAGHQATKVFNNNLPVSETDPLGNKTIYGYDANFNLTSVIDPRGNETTMTYDSRGNMLTRTLPGPQSPVESYTYAATNELTALMDPLGHITRYDYDANGNLVKTTFADGATIEMTYSGGLPTSMTDARGKTWSYEYDAHGNRTAVTSPLGFKRTFQYDVTSRLTAEVSPEGNEPGADPTDYTTAYSYDTGDHKLSETDPLGNETTWQYDAVGNPAATTDANDDTSSYGYDAANRLTTITAPDDATTTTGYDDVGNIVSRTDANDHTTSYAYDGDGRRTSLTDPLGNESTYSYDPNGNLTAVVAAGGGTVFSSYDALNRLTETAYSDGTPTVSYTYDAAGNPLEMTDGAGVQTYTYDDRNRLSSVTRGSDSFTYGYDIAGNLTARNYPNASQTYSYDDDNRLAAVSIDGTATTYGYDASGRQIELSLPNGYTETRDYDPAGRTTGVKNADSSGILSQYDYAYDPIGQATTIVTLDGVEKYSYDSQGRLATVCYQASCTNPADPHIDYGYDPVGNRLSEETADGTTTYTYNAADQLTETTSPAQTTAYSYDPRGNQTGAGDRSFTWNLADKMTSTTKDSSTINYSYDGDGNRLLADGPNSTTTYVWDVNNDMPQLALERDNAGDPVRTYIYGANTLGMKSSGATYYDPDPVALDTSGRCFL